LNFFQQDIKIGFTPGSWGAPEIIVCRSFPEENLYTTIPFPERASGVIQFSNPSSSLTIHNRVPDGINALLLMPETCPVLRFCGLFHVDPVPHFR
jgi:hypothetical protein